MIMLTCIYTCIEKKNAKKESNDMLRNDVCVCVYLVLFYLHESFD